MNLLQELITSRMGEGKSYRDIERETGISHVSISKYHNGSVPDGKNLAILAKYFRTEFHELVDAVRKHHVPAVDLGGTLEDRMAEQVWQTLSREQKWQAVQMLREISTTGEK